MKPLLYTLCISLLLMLSSCDQKGTDNRSAASSDTADTVQLVKAYTPEQRQELLESWKARRDNTQTKIAELRKKMDPGNAKANPELEAKLDDLLRRQTDIEQRLEALMAHTGDAFEDQKSGLDSAWAEMDIAIGQAAEAMRH